MRKLICIFSIISIIFCTSINVYAITDMEYVNFIGKVNVNLLNVRQGPGTKYAIIEKIKKNDKVHAICKIGNWYLVELENGVIGLCSREYITSISEYTIENKILDAINKLRKSNNIKKLALDTNLSEIAKIKAKDMIDNNYLSHESENLGLPYDMLNKYKVSFLTVGENIAKSNNVEDFIKFVTTSTSYKENSLSNDYNYTGLAVVPMDEYNYIYVQIFVGRK